MVDVVVPSPTESPVRSAAWRIICAPRFSSGSLRSNSLAMVTPSLQTIGTPHALPMSTLFDLGPSAHSNGIGESGRSSKKLLARRGMKQQLLVAHGHPPSARVCTRRAHLVGRTIAGPSIETRPVQRRRSWGHGRKRAGGFRPTQRDAFDTHPLRGRAILVDVPPRIARSTVWHET